MSKSLAITSTSPGSNAIFMELPFPFDRVNPKAGTSISTSEKPLVDGSYLEIFCFINSVDQTDSTVMSKMSDYLLLSGWEEVERLTTFWGYRIQ